MTCLFSLAVQQQQQQQDNTLSQLENWFGASVYTKTYPRMPSDRVLSACDLEQ